MSYLAIMSWDANNRISKVMRFDTKGAAEVHGAAFSDKFPDAFVSDYDGPERDALVDPVAKTVSLVPLPPPVPSSITRRQIMLGLAAQNFITREECIDALKYGDMPAAVAAIVASLPEDQQLAAEARWIDFSDAHRNDDMVAALAAQAGMTSDQVDAFFIACASIN